MGRLSPPRFERLEAVVKDPESWMSDAVWALALMARSRARGREQETIMFYVKQ